MDLMDVYGPLTVVDGVDSRGLGVMKIFILRSLAKFDRLILMDDEALFDVFDLGNDAQPSPGQTRQKKTHKGNANGKRAHEQQDRENGGDVVLKRKKIAQNPIVVDSFETESDQIVPAAQGLQGAPVDGDSNIVIKKRVSSQSTNLT
jgi:hypothetical protein